MTVRDAQDVRDLVERLVMQLKFRQVHFFDSDEDIKCLDCNLQEKHHGGYGWTFKHAPDCELHQLLEEAAAFLKSHGKSL